MSDPLETVIEIATDGVTVIGASFTEPDDDWAPVLILQLKAGKGAVVGIDGNFLASQQSKDLLAHEVIPQAIREFEAIGAAFVSSSWMVASDDRKVAPSEHPDREEVVMVTAMTAGEHAFLMARISRHADRPPELGEFERLPASTDFEGRFVGPIRRALAHQG